jgi:hypothetical protein
MVQAAFNLRWRQYLRGRYLVKVADLATILDVAGASLHSNLAIECYTPQGQVSPQVIRRPGEILHPHLRPATADIDVTVWDPPTPPATLNWTEA